MRLVRFTFRSKLMALVGVAALALALLIVTSEVTTARLERQTSAIQEKYPRLVLEPELDASFERLKRGFQDSVAAHDEETLMSTRVVRAELEARLTRAGGIVAPRDAAALRAALEAYDNSAFDVSRRLIHDETGEALVEAMADMQAKQAKMTDALEVATRFDPRELRDAFAAVAQSNDLARVYRLAISALCLALVLILSVGLSRSLLRSVAELTAGFERFGSGRFKEPIVIAGGDEWGDLAAHANLMASSLERSTDERERAEAGLLASNQELEAFSYSVAHDLRAPLRGINGLSRALMEDMSDKLDAGAADYLVRIGAAAERMGLLIDALLALSRVSRVELQDASVNLSQLATGVVAQLRLGQPERVVDFACEPGIVHRGDPALLLAVLDNLLGNAWKFTGARQDAKVSFGRETTNEERPYFVRDNGAGFDMAYADKLFAPFQRLHSAKEFAGTGVGLATVQRIIHRHGGRIWADSAVGKGATFYFTLGSSLPRRPS